MEQYSKEDFVKYDGSIVYGRVARYDAKKGYGFIRIANGKDIFVSSYNMSSKRTEKNFIVGAVVSFYIVCREGKYSADNVFIVRKNPNGTKLVLPSGDSINLHELIYFYYVPERECICFFVNGRGKITICKEDLEGRTVEEYFQSLSDTYLSLSGIQLSGIQ